MQRSCCFQQISSRTMSVLARVALMPIQRRREAKRSAVLHVVDGLAAKATSPRQKLVEEFHGLKRMRKALPEGCLEQLPSRSFEVRFGTPVGRDSRCRKPAPLQSDSSWAACCGKIGGPPAFRGGLWNCVPGRMPRTHTSSVTDYFTILTYSLRRLVQGASRSVSFPIVVLGK